MTDSLRTLVRELPDLLDGNEPELRKPEFMARLKSDPLAIAAMCAAADLSMILSTNGRRRKLCHGASGSARASKYFARELSETLFQLAASIFARATIDGKRVYVYHAWGWHENVGALENRVGSECEIADAFGVEFVSELPVVRHVIAHSVSARTALVVLSCARRLTPGWAGIEFLSLLIGQSLGEEVGAAAWVNRQHYWSTTSTLGGAHHQAAYQMFLTTKVPEKALPYDVEAIRWIPGSAFIAYQGMLHASLAGNDHWARCFADTLARNVGSDSALRTALSLQVKRDYDDWVRISREYVWLFEGVERTLRNVAIRVQRWNEV